MNLPDLLDSIATSARGIHQTGRVADDIPILAAVDPNQFGMAFANIDGDVVGSGDFRVPFSIQSISKAFTLSLVLAREGETLWTRVGREPSGNPFNSLVQLEYEHGIPRNPFINAGALVVVDRLLSATGSAFETVREFLRVESGNALLDLDSEVASSEAEHSHRNAALAHFMASYDNLKNPVDQVLSHYIRLCSLAMSVAGVAALDEFTTQTGWSIF